MAAEDLDAFDAHVDRCARCRRFVSAAAVIAATGAELDRSVTRAVVTGHTSPSPSSSELTVGQTADHFRVNKLLGRGGMGAVYLAHDEQLGRDVALKVIKSELVDSEAARARFQIEARATARLNHPNIVTIHGVGLLDRAPYVELEFVQGQSLQEELDGPRRLDRRASLKIMLDVAVALAEAHRQGVLHLDLKPSNLLLGDDGRVRVLDFGLAKIIHEAGAARIAKGEPVGAMTSAAGTPAYMAPEQWQGYAAGKATDMWAFGAILYRLLSGRRPFPVATLAALRAAVCDGDFAPIYETPPAPVVAAVINSCLDRRMESRPSAASVAARLRQALDQLQPRPSPRWSRRLLLLVTLTALSALAVSVAITTAKPLPLRLIDALPDAPGPWPSNVDVRGRLAAAGWEILSESAPKWNATYNMYVFSGWRPGPRGGVSCVVTLYWFKREVLFHQMQKTVSEMDHTAHTVRGAVLFAVTVKDDLAAARELLVEIVPPI